MDSKQVRALADELIDRLSDLDQSIATKTLDSLLGSGLLLGRHFNFGVGLAAF
jgi:hypothetical protein